MIIGEMNIPWVVLIFRYFGHNYLDHLSRIINHARSLGGGMSLDRGSLIEWFCCGHVCNLRFLKCWLKNVKIVLKPYSFLLLPY